MLRVFIEYGDKVLKLMINYYQTNFCKNASLFTNARGQCYSGAKSAVNETRVVCSTSVGNNVVFLRFPQVTRFE